MVQNPLTECNVFTNTDYHCSFIFSQLLYYLCQFKDCCSCLLLLQQLKCSVTLKHEVYRTGHYRGTWREENKIPNHIDVLPILMTQVLPESATVIFKHLKWETTTAESIIFFSAIHPPKWDEHAFVTSNPKVRQLQGENFDMQVTVKGASRLVLSDQCSVLQITSETPTAHPKVKNFRKYLFF